MKNADLNVVADFGREWATFDQSKVPNDELTRAFGAYFTLINWEHYRDSVGFDCGCGTGRWAAFVAPRVRELHCVEPAAEALNVAKKKLAAFSNVRFHNVSVSEMPFPDGSMDFAYSLGVLHHIPDTAQGIKDCARKLKPGAPLVLYLYYSVDRRPGWFQALYRAHDVARRVISRWPFWAKRIVADVIAATIYWPLARLAPWAFFFSGPNNNWPLANYARKCFYTMRTDALDRFGTRLEQRFTQERIRQMMIDAGLMNIRFSELAPFWVCRGDKER